jgi:hypothetical protein
MRQKKGWRSVNTVVSAILSFPRLLAPWEIEPGDLNWSICHYGIHPRPRPSADVTRHGFLLPWLLPRRKCPLSDRQDTSFGLSVYQPVKI